MAEKFLSAVAPEAASAWLLLLQANKPRADERFPKNLSFERRLHHPWEYKRFFGHSEVIRLSHCTIFRIPNELDHFRLGITLKARGSSVERNRVKRRIRETFRNHAAILGNFDYNVVISGNKKLAFPYPQKLAESLRKELPHALSRK